MPMGSASANAATTRTTAEKQSALADVKRMVLTLAAGLDDAFTLLDMEDEIKRLHSQAQLDAAAAAKDRAAAGDALVDARAEAIRLHTHALEEADRTRAKADADLTDIRKRLEADRKAFADEMAARSAEMTHRQANQDMRENILQDMEMDVRKREAEADAREAALMLREATVSAAEAAMASKMQALSSAVNVLVNN